MDGWIDVDVDTDRFLSRFMSVYIFFFFLFGKCPCYRLLWISFSNNRWPRDEKIGYLKITETDPLPVNEVTT